MKQNITSTTLVILSVAILYMSLAPPVNADNDCKSPQTACKKVDPGKPKYVVVKLGSLGGTVGRSNAVNDRGWVSGWSNLSGDNNLHAVLWIDGHPNDLGTLGGPNSQIEFITRNDFGHARRRI